MQFVRILNENTASKDEKTEPESSIEHFFRIFDPLRTKKIGPQTLGGAAAGSNDGTKRTCGVIWACFDEFFRRFDVVFDSGPGGGPWEGGKGGG